MSNNSIIEHRSNYFYIEFREEYLTICLECQYKKPGKSKASPYCKALILAIMESWTNDKRGKGEDLAIYMTYPQWIDAMYGMFGRCVIIDSLDELLGEGLLSREKHRMYGKDTYKYRLNYQDLNRRIKLLPERDPKHTRPKVDASTNRRQNDSNASKSRRDTRLKVDDDPSKSRHNIESTKKQNIESNEGTPSPEIDSTQTGTPSLTPSSSFSQKKDLSTPDVNNCLPDVDKPSTHRNTEPLPRKPHPEAIRVFGLLCEVFYAMPPEVITEKIESQCRALAPHVRNVEDLKSLRDYARAEIMDDPAYKKKQVHLGNLVKAVNGWKQKQYKPDPATPKTSKEPSQLEKLKAARARAEQSRLLEQAQAGGK